MPFSTLITLFKNWADDLLNSAQYLPITVTTAIALFVIKEVLDHKRKGRERLRKLNAIKLLLSQELEKNYWALISFFRVLVEIKEANLRMRMSKEYGLPIFIPLYMKSTLPLWPSMMKYCIRRSMLPMRIYLNSFTIEKH